MHVCVCEILVPLVCGAFLFQVTNNGHTATQMMHACMVQSMHMHARINEIGKVHDDENNLMLI